METGCHCIDEIKHASKQVFVPLSLPRACSLFAVYVHAESSPHLFNQVHMDWSFGSE